VARQGRGHQAQSRELGLCHQLGVGTGAAQSAREQQDGVLGIDWTCFAKLPVNGHDAGGF